MTVHCPHCTRGYQLSEHLMGSTGARVHCPGCGGTFVVRWADDASAGERESSARPETAPDVVSGSRASGRGSPALQARREEPLPAAETRQEAEPAPEKQAEDPAAAARAILDVLADFLGDSLVRARTRGTVLSEHGPAIMAVWDEYRRRAGEDAPAAVFRLALAERCGVDLMPRGGG